MWIEQDDPEEIVIDEDDVEEPTTIRAPVRVKFEDEQMEDVVVPDEITPAARMDIDLMENEEFLKMAEKRRRKLRRKAMKGKSREEKEEIAREEVDFEVMQKTFLEADASQVLSHILLRFLMMYREKIVCSWCNYLSLYLPSDPSTNSTSNKKSKSKTLQHPKNLSRTPRHPKVKSDNFASTRPAKPSFPMAESTFPSASPTKSASRKIAWSLTPASTKKPGE
jgi:hypothetical protein